MNGAQGNNPEQLLSDARAAFQNGKIQDAYALATESLRLAPDNLPGLELRAVSACHMGKLSQGAESFSRLTELQPNHANHWFNLGNALLSDNQAAAARNALEQANELQPEHPECLLLLAQACRDCGDVEDAHGYLDTALARNTEHFGCLNAKGNLYARQGEFAQAAEYFSRALQLEPKSIPLQLNIGQIYLQTGQFERAENAFQNALTLDAHCVPARMGVAQTARAQGRLDDAAHHYRQVLRKHANAPDSQGALLAGIDALLAAHKFDDADRWIADYGPRVDAAETQRAKAAIAVERMQWHDLQQVISAQMSEDDVVLNKMLAVAAFYDGNLAQAKDLAQRANQTLLSQLSHLDTSNTLSQRFEDVTELAKEYPYAPPDDKADMVFILAAPGAHGDTLAELLAWNSKAQTVWQAQLGPRLRRAEQDPQVSIQNAAQQWLNSIRSDDQRELIVDYTDWQTTNLVQILSAFPNARFVWVDKDQTTAAFESWITPKPINAANFKLLDWHQCQQTHQQMQQILHQFCEIDPARFLRVTLDDLALQTEATATKICAHLNLQYEPEMLQGADTIAMKQRAKNRQDEILELMRNET